MNFFFHFVCYCLLFIFSIVIKKWRCHKQRIKKPLKFYVVQFMSVGRPAKTRCMDVVSGKWLFKNKSNDGLYGYYPERAWEPEQFKTLNQHLKNSSTAPPHWKIYKVDIKRKSSKLTALEICTPRSTVLFRFWDHNAYNAITHHVLYNFFVFFFSFFVF